MARLTSKQRKRLKRLLGNPPDPNRVPAEFWTEIAEETKRETQSVLLLLFMASAQFHAGTIDTLTQKRLDADGEAYGRERSTILAQEYAATSRQRFATLENDLAEIERGNQKRQAEFEADSRSDPTRKDPRAGKPPKPRRMPPDRLDARLTKIFGPKRAEGVAVTETTQAQSSGGDAGIAATVGLTLGDRWITKDDDLVCPICGPLHNTRREFWGLLHFDGPPAHPWCRCKVDYEGLK